MPEATYVAYVPRDLREKLRCTLQSGDTGDLTWREQRARNGSEFYFTGPAALARRTHAYITQWVATRAL